MKVDAGADWRQNAAVTGGDSFNVWDVAVLACTILLPLLFLVLLAGLFHGGHGKTRRWGRIVLGNLLTILFLGSLFLSSLEWYYRWVRDETDSYGYSRANARWFARHWKRNHMGFRDNIEYPLAVPGGQTRVTFLGDSFTAAHGLPNVEDRFVNRVRSLKSGWEVHGAALCGWNTGEHVRFVRWAVEHGYRLETVVLVYCLNDLVDLSPSWASVRFAGQVIPRHPLIRHSYFLDLWTIRFRVSRIAELRDYFDYVESAYTGETWPRQKKRLEELRRAVEDSGGRLVAVTFPFLHGLDNGYAHRAIHEQLDRFWTERGVPHLDLLPVFEGRRSREVTVGRYDAHPNAAAHAGVAHALAAFLGEHIPP